mgnify:FL=1
MSRVVVDNIAVGEACTITSPNSTTASLAAATAAVDDENLRLEGIDRRNLVIPGASLAAVVQFPSGSITSPANTSTIVGAMAQCPPISGQIPEIVIGVQNAAFVIVRLSCEMSVDGGPLQGAATPPNREASGRIGIAVAMNSGPYTLIDETFRSWQLGNIPNTGGSPRNETRQSIHIVYVHTPLNLGSGMTYKYTPWVGAVPGWNGTTGMVINNINLSAVVYRGL